MEERPLPHYAALAGAFWTVFGAFLAASRGRLPDQVPFRDVVLVALSTYKLSRVIAKEEITAFVRAPVTEDAEAQQPKRDGAARVFGELVTCPYCIGLWIASGLSFSLVRFPRETRFATAIFGAYGLADFFHAGFVRLRGQT